MAAKKKKKSEKKVVVSFTVLPETKKHLMTLPFYTVWISEVIVEALARKSL